MQYFFVLGRNPELSLAEIFSYANREENSVLSFFQNQNSAIIEFKKSLQQNAISKLGGVISIGEILAEGKLNEILQQLEKKEIYVGVKNNFSYTLLNFSNESSLEKISEYMKKRFKAEKLKASEKKEKGEMQYFLTENKGCFYFGKITEKCDYSEIERRDMKKPVRREELSIPPRLAKMMINLSEIRNGEKMLDPFCGIGVILQEALLQNIKTIGFDNDSNAILGAKQNLEWFGFSKENYSLMKADSTKINLNQAEVLVTEPDFGELLKKIPSIEKAKHMQKEYERLMISVLNNFKKRISGKFVFTAPLISIGKKRLPCNIEEILKKTNLKLAKGFPIQDFRESQIVGREIYVLER
ncbi:MAG: DNA methyltransferase [archaeon]